MQTLLMSDEWAKKVVEVGVDNNGLTFDDHEPWWSGNFLTFTTRFHCLPLANPSSTRCSFSCHYDHHIAISLESDKHGRLRTKCDGARGETYGQVAQGGETSKGVSVRLLGHEMG
jgi:hypothetical protein